MDTLHRLAGVTEASDSPNPPSQPFPQPPPIPQDSDAVSVHSSHYRGRASLPLNRRASHKSFKSGKSRNRSQSPVPDLPTSSQQPAADTRQSHESQRTGLSTSDDGFTWGPTHPCFPHPNPHCAPDSEEAQTTRVIRVRRDWLQSGDLYPQYANLYPEILDPLVTDDEFRFLISNLNSRLKATFDPFTARAAVDAVMGVVTGFVWDDLGLTGAKKGMKELEGFVEGWNRERARQGKEVRMVQLRRTGFMALDFLVPDPGIEEMVGGEIDTEGEAGSVGLGLRDDVA